MCCDLFNNYNLSYKTFEGTEAEAIDPNTGQEIKAPNGTSLLRRDFQQGYTQQTKQH